MFYDVLGSYFHLLALAIPCYIMLLTKALSISSGCFCIMELKLKEETGDVGF
jgi:hypothetical protein